MEEKEKVCEVKERSDKKLKLKINVRRIVDEYIYALKGQSEYLSRGLTGSKFISPGSTGMAPSRDLLPVIVLSFVSDRVIEHFGIAFKIN